MISLLVGYLVVAVSSAHAGTLDDALVFRASFDRGLDADMATGDKRLYSAPKVAFPPKASAGLPASGVITHEKSGGVTGGYLRFRKKSPEMVFYKAEGNMPYVTTNWSGSVSFWLRLAPDEDLEPGYADPIQITSKAWNNGAFFVEFSKDETPREFRLGIYPDFAIWNPQNRDWNSIPMSEKPLAPVVRPPFSRVAWTHVVFTFQNFNTGRPDGSATLYLNGKKAAVLPPRTQTFTWDLDQCLIMLGLSYVGDWDELAIFKRPLTAEEISTLHTAKGALK